MSGAPIQPAPPTYGAEGATNEKHEYQHVAPQQTGTTDHTQQYPQQPQETYQQNPAHEQQQNSYKQDGPPQNHVPGNTYATAIPLANLQQGAAPVDCPICHKRELTETEHVSGGTTHLSALLCCCVLCLGCIPYLATWFKDVEHKCGSCGALLAVWHRSGRTEVMAHPRA